MRKPLISIALAGAALLHACAGDTLLRPTAEQSPLQSETSGLPQFLSLAAGAPTLTTSSVSFYAVNGQTQEAFIWYHPKAGEPDSSKLVRLRVDRRSLCTRPDGSPITPGDSILITMTVTDSTKQLVEFQPAGLVFCSGRPAKLQMWYVETDHDFNHDGVVNAADDGIEQLLSIWKRETPASPWIKVSSVIEADEDEVEADIPGFTGYLVAY